MRGASHDGIRIHRQPSKIAYGSWRCLLRHDFHHVSHAQGSRVAWAKVRLLGMMMDWQLIDTAPKDGTVILAWDGYDMATVKWAAKPYVNPTYGCWELVAAGFRAEDADFENPILSVNHNPARGEVMKWHIHQWRKIFRSNRFFWTSGAISWHGDGWDLVGKVCKTCGKRK